MKYWAREQGVSYRAALNWFHAGTLPAARFATAVEDLQRMTFEHVPTRRMLIRAYTLQANVSSYDATYVALAETLDCELLTSDQRLAAATGPTCTIRVLT